MMKPVTKQLSDAALQSFTLSRTAGLIEENAVASTKLRAIGIVEDPAFRRSNHQAGAEGQAIAVLPRLVALR